MPLTYNVNTDMVLSNTVLVYINNTPIAFAKDFKLTSSTASIDTSNKFSGRFKNSIPGQISWNVTSSFLKTNVSGDTSYNTLFDQQMSGQTVNITIAVVDPASTAFAMLGSGQFTGVAIIDALDMNAVHDGVVDCSVTLGGTGSLTRVVGS